MALALYAHPLSSYSMKALIAFYEKDVPFEYRNVGEAPCYAGLSDLWPVKRFPVLVDGDRTILESSVIIEHLDRGHPGAAPLLPADPAAAIDVRMLDRVFDNYVSTPQQRIVFDVLRPVEKRDPTGVDEARAMLDAAYAWLEAHMHGRSWAAGDSFSLADCAAAPSLFYADWTHPMAGRFPALAAYRARLLARPSFARAVEEARPYRHLFPLPIPEGA